MPTAQANSQKSERPSSETLRVGTCRTLRVSTFFNAATWASLLAPARLGSHLTDLIIRTIAPEKVELRNHIASATNLTFVSCWCQKRGKSETTRVISFFPIVRFREQSEGKAKKMMKGGRWTWSYLEHRFCLWYLQNMLTIYSLFQR